MRFAPAAVALSLLVAVTSSVSFSAEPKLSPRAAMLLAEGKAALAQGESQKAIDAFEAALAVEPASSAVLIELGEASRREGLQGKAIGYYREALERDPGNLAAISGEGLAMVEKGAVEKARRNLVQLKSMCGADCAATKTLALAIMQAPQPRVLTAEAVMPDSVVSQN